MKQWYTRLLRFGVTASVGILLLILLFSFVGASGQAGEWQEVNASPQEQGGLPMCPGLAYWQEYRFETTPGPCGEFMETYVAVYAPNPDGSFGRRIGTGIIRGRPDSPAGYTCFACGDNIDQVLRTIRLDATGQVIPIQPCRIFVPANTFTNRTRIQIATLLPGWAPPRGCDKAQINVNSGGVQVNYTPFDGVRFSVHLPWPKVLYDVDPYPVGLVGNPTRITMVDTPVSRRSAYRFYLARGGGRPSEPQFGDVRNIWYQMRLVPLVARGGVVAPPAATGDPQAIRLGETVTVTWDLPSHPASGAKPAPAMAQRVGLATDFPAFSSEDMSQVAYGLACYLSWEEYVIDDTGAHWVRRSMGGFVPINAVRVSGDRRYFADTNGDGRPDVLINRQVALRRRDAAGNVVDTISLGERTYWWVREAQAQISR